MPADLRASATHERWCALVDRLDARVLADRFTSLLPAVPDYDPPPVPMTEVLRTGTLTFAALLDRLRSEDVAEFLPAARDVGVTRARAGIPITSLMTAIRLDFTVLWHAISEIAEPEDAGLLVRQAGVVLAAVDEYAGQAQSAYMTELHRIREEASSVRQGLIARLFQSPSPTDVQLVQIGGDLGLPHDAPLLVAAAIGDDMPPLRALIAEGERAGATILTHHLGDTLIAFTRSVDYPGSRIATFLRGIADHRVGACAAPRGLVDVQESAATARVLAQALDLDDTRAMTWERGWARVAQERLAHAGHPVIADVERALDSCGPAERERLVDAVRDYLITGSVSASAARLYCHRNTLTNRLGRFARLTGIDPFVPQQAARLVVGWA
ncbi:helix-turn-helix domain-containing protein [Leucobacter tardus]|uniref:Helix-turn-helix domain-containing protein n=1 Tax=Leucobacter tardus TaxID=501483 RepID=A0A939QIY0_9MICO|nr:helix-turn-helix domain-containing protein [Leucobacter tardus]MBO2988554.1 helix-turn-helix domain-containing protein [Leucobacter tardus]